MTWSCEGCRGENPDGTRFCGLCGTPRTSPPARAPESSRDAVIDVLKGFVSTPVADRVIASGGRLAEERRVVTALFADLSGFTKLATSMDPEQLVEVIDPVLTALTTVVADYGGHVEKFAGDALLALFGAPVAHDDDAERALRAALDMHRRVVEVSPLPPGELTLHIGINSGPVIARVMGAQVRLDYGVLGDTVVLAQRLESQTPTGETYVGESTARLARDRFAFEPVGPFVLKGRPQPEVAWRLLGEQLSTASHALLHGRSDESAALEAFVRGAGTGTGGALLVTGEPGSGKSSLIGAARAADRGSTWVSGQCLPYGASLPYRPYTDVVRALTEPAHRDPYLRHLMGDPDVELPAQGPEAVRRGIHAAVVAVLTAASQQGPVVCVLEDLHWADTASVGLTLELLGAVASMPVALVLTARTGELPAALADGLAGVQALALHPLEREVLADLAADVLEGPAPQHLVDLLADRCAGNPLFARELTRALRDDGVLTQEAGRWRLPAGWQSDLVPETVEGVLAARLDRLPPHAVEVLQAAAVVGRRFRLPLLAALVPDADLHAALTVLVDRGVVVDDGGSCSFQHALLQEAAYNRLLRRRRRELHLLAAAAAVQLYGDGDETVELLARHLYLGDAGVPALAALRRAGAKAGGLYANDEACLHLRRAVEVCRAHPELDGELPGLLLTLAQLEELRGSYAAAQASYEEVMGRTDDVQAWAGRASMQRRLGEVAAAEQTLEQALAAPRQGDMRSLWFERAWLLSTTARLREAEDAALVGLSLSPAPPDALAGQLLLKLALLESEDGRAAESVTHAREALDALERSDDLAGQAQALRILGASLEACGRYADAADVLRRGLAIAEKVGSVEEICGCLVNLGMLSIRLGTFEQGVRDTERAVEELSRIGHRIGVAIATSNLGELLLCQGRLEEAESTLVRALGMSEALDYPALRGDVQQNLSRLAAERGEHDRAAVLAEDAATSLTQADLHERAREMRAAAAAHGQRAAATH